MQFSKVIVTLPNGRIKRFSSSDFDFYASTNELEHKEENIIITLDNLSYSFIYECEELTGEMLCKEFLFVELE